MPEIPTPDPKPPGGLKGELAETDQAEPWQTRRAKESDRPTRSTASFPFSWIVRRSGWMVARPEPSRWGWPLNQHFSREAVTSTCTRHSSPFAKLNAYAMSGRMPLPAHLGRSLCSRQQQRIIQSQDLQVRKDPHYLAPFERRAGHRASEGGSHWSGTRPSAYRLCQSRSTHHLRAPRLKVILGKASNICAWLSRCAHRARCTAAGKQTGKRRPLRQKHAKRLRRPLL